MSLFKIINFKSYTDDRGCLTVAEKARDIEFEIKRTYFLKNLDSRYPRGFHAHYNLKQVAICINGSCDMIFDDGSARETYTMRTSSEGVIIPPMVWHEMHNFSKDCVLLLFASDLYDEGDYIRDYEDFLELVNK
jgi:dTDP-4-dehydrorhamnose 3,5-epimerase-like enzyme